MDFSQVITEAGAVALAALALVKAAVDGVKLYAPEAKSSTLMALALGFGLLFVNLLALAAGAEYTVQTGALYVIAGILAGFGSMGLHQLGEKATERRMSALYGVESATPAAELHDH